MDRRLGWGIDTERVALVSDVMVGFKELLAVLTEPGDGVVVCTPAYPPYFMDIPHVGREVVEVPLLEDFGLDFDGLDRGVRGRRESAAAVLAAQPERAGVHAGGARADRVAHRRVRRARDRRRDPCAADASGSSRPG